MFGLILFNYVALDLTIHENKKKLILKKQIYRIVESEPIKSIYQQRSYFANIYDSSFFVWSDYILAPLWCVVVFWFSFRSPLYWWLGSLKGYKLTAQSAYGVGYARRHNL